jgi:hypothetical protein
MKTEQTPPVLRPNPVRDGIGKLGGGRSPRRPRSVGGGIVTQYRLQLHGRRGVSGGLLDEGDRPSRERTVLIEEALAMATRRCVLALRQARVQGTTRDLGATAMRGTPALRASDAPSIARPPEAGREDAVWR